MKMIYTKEVLSEQFTKHRLDRFGENKFHGALHDFTGPDIGGPHDHPYSFKSFILQGSYLERIYDSTDGSFTDVLRSQGDVLDVPATRIHEIISLPEGMCQTFILPGPPEQDWGFWNFESVVGVFTKHKE